MTILVIGGKNGQLAESFKLLNDDRLVFVGRPEFDFTQPDTLKIVFQGDQKPKLIVNTAAWTAVDAAETNQEDAYLVNRDGPAQLAKLCAVYDVPLIHVSTDYVFSGDKGSPYTETDPVSPETVYGASKAEGEQAILAAQPNSVILRTAWVYSAHNKNFVLTMINAGAKNPALKVVGDQHGNPTCSDDLAWAIIQIADRYLKEGWNSEWNGIYHAVGTGDATWYELAVEALQQAALYGQKMPEISAIKTEDWPTPAKRPQDSRLNTDKLYQVFNVRLPKWQDSVAKVVQTVFNA
ncbi:dTDP-4-dehydrorhamnose reductase [Commensalibacter nepenthis]|uniref:dTDP-4-dehydrorhamnose reductase n=1 Tax=Commensalibacter nepenthis TaxID=3043872 RepID=A0ABT6Q7B2_9PROT|nr:dTDP-4-dehydrorhamnose reductase [Commensalibacter sp. TBRC 10068]MDI2112774.1 dTDP-4-dehydrorhamnose reductase [Commensalibacter sp. TBRC 10068]